MRAARVEINLAALQHNLSCIKQFAPHSHILAMVKANAYGHGLATVAGALAEADAFGVACIEEAICLREAGIQQRIVLMEGFFSADELDMICALNLDVVIHHLTQLEILEQCPRSKAMRVWLKIDTGMHRLGFAPADAVQIWQRLQRCTAVAAIECVMTHFAEADNIEKNTTQQQFRRFAEAVGQIPVKRSLANSAGILAWPETHGEWVRPGILLYGVSPFANMVGIDHGLQPAMTVISELIAVKQLAKGEAIGYGGSWICPEDMPIGVVAIGYGDGYPRSAQKGTPVLVNNVTVPLVGRVSMDMLTVDLRRYPNAKVGDKVILWGEGLPIEEVAQNAQTIAYELLCGIAQRLKIVTRNAAPLASEMAATLYT